MATSDQDTAVARPRGRPRSERAKSAVLGAAADMLLADGFAAMSAEGIARRAGVSKATIYKWWPSKAAVAVDAFLATVLPQVPDVDHGDVRRELLEPALTQLRLFRETPVGRALASFVAEAQADPDVAEALRTRWLQPRRRQAIKAITRAQERGELRADVDGEIVLDLIFGPIYYRLLVGHQPLDDSLAHTAVDAILDGLRVR